MLFPLSIGKGDYTALHGTDRAGRSLLRFFGFIFFWRGLGKSPLGMGIEHMTRYDQRHNQNRGS